MILSLVIVFSVSSSNAAQMMIPGLLIVACMEMVFLVAVVVRAKSDG